MQLKLNSGTRRLWEMRDVVAGTFSTVIVAYMSSSPIRANELCFSERFAICLFLPFEEVLDAALSAGNGSQISVPV
jgi:hypothetical protein